MALSIDWGTKVITVPTADLTLVDSGPPPIYELDVNDLHLWLKDMEDSEEGMPHLDTHRHVTEITLGGVTYARFVEIINGYTITFEDGQYRAKLTGGNNNVLDVANVNQVSVAPQNSAGLITYSGADPVTVAAAVWDRVLNVANHDITNSAGRRLRELGTIGDIANGVLTAVVEGSITLQQAQRLMLSVLTGKSSGGGGSTITFRDTTDNKDRVVADVDANGNRVDVTTRDGS